MDFFCGDGGARGHGHDRIAVVFWVARDDDAPGSHQCAHRKDWAARRRNRQGGAVSPVATPACPARAGGRSEYTQRRRLRRRPCIFVRLARMRTAGGLTIDGARVRGARFFDPWIDRSIERVSGFGLQRHLVNPAGRCIAWFSFCLEQRAAREERGCVTGVHGLVNPSSGTSLKC